MQDPEEKVAEETIPHTVTSEDLENNPELTKLGIAEGDEIGLPVNAEAPGAEVAVAQEEE